MTYDQWKTANPYDEELEDRCDFCNEPCNGAFCSDSCRKGYDQDN